MTDRIRITPREERVGESLENHPLPTHKERERKWLISNPPSLVGVPGKYIEQGYLTIGADGSETRIRNKEGKFTLTVKSGGDLERDEFETVITIDQFDDLWGATEGKRIYKVRYEIGYGDFKIELDVYQRKLAGLVVAEVEFRTLEEAKAFQPPPWFGSEVTADPAYRNSNLAA